eukprot:9173075-Ditylum_brightwellii.AAC.1
MKVIVLQKKEALIQQTAMSSGDSTNKQPNPDMIGNTSIDYDREYGSKDGGKIPGIEKVFNGINSSSVIPKF